MRTAGIPSRVNLSLCLGVALGYALAIFSSKEMVVLDANVSTSKARATSTTAKVPDVTLETLVEEGQVTPRLGDGCYHVFLDLGANIGVHGRFLFEPHQYPKAKKAEKFFLQAFGNKTRDNRDFCVFAFEPNPNHHRRLHKVSQAYAAMGWRFHVIPKGISDHGSNLTFYRWNDKKYSEWGFSMTKPPPDNAFPSGTPNTEIQVAVVRLAKWIEHHIQDRTLPKEIQGNYPYDTPRVLMKMDVEGMEFPVMADMLLTGVFCRNINLAFTEVHLQDFRFPMRVNHQRSGLVLHDKKQASRYWHSFEFAIKANADCHGRLVQGDDEAYLWDGRPLPVQENTKHKINTTTVKTETRSTESKEDRIEIG